MSLGLLCRCSAHHAALHLDISANVCTGAGVPAPSPGRAGATHFAPRRQSVASISAPQPMRWVSSASDLPSTRGGAKSEPSEKTLMAEISSSSAAPKSVRADMTPA